MPKLALNKFACISSGCGNTGIPDCEFVPSNIVGAIAIPQGSSFNPTEIETLNVVLQDAAYADLPANRVYPIKPFTNFTDNSEDAVMDTSGYGQDRFIRDGQPKWEFELSLGLYSWTKLRNFNNKPRVWDWLFIDATNNVIWGLQNSSGNLGGFQLSNLMVKKFNLPGGSNAFTYNIAFAFNDLAQFERSAIVQFGSDVQVLDAVSGLLDLNITVTTALAAGVVVVKVFAANGAIDMYDVYSASLASGTVWKAVNTDTGATITITSVVAAPGQKAFTVTLSTGDPDYPANTEFLTLSLAAPSILSANGLLGFDSCPINLEV